MNYPYRPSPPHPAAAIIAKLSKAGFTEITGSYSGSNDEGFVDSVVLNPKTTEENSVLSNEEQHELEDYIYSRLPNVDHGGSGTYKLDLRTNSLTHTFEEADWDRYSDESDDWG